MNKGLIKRYGKKIIIGGVIYKVSTDILYHLYLIKTKNAVIRTRFSAGHRNLEIPKMSVGKCVSFNQFLQDEKEIDIVNIKVKDLDALHQDFLKLEGVTDETEITALIDFMIEKESE